MQAKRVAPPVILAAIVYAATFGVRAASPSDTALLDVPDRVDATPSIAAAGSLVAVAWGAMGGGKSDVYVAVSKDGGSTFGQPVRVNQVLGEGRLGGEMPPRIALLSKSRSATPDMVVLWTARGATTEIRTARSRDGGRTFETPTSLQSPNAAGDRGWPSVALDSAGGAHALWLDHRGLAASRAASTATGHAGHQAAAVHDGVAMAQNSGLYYASPSGERELTKGVCYCCKTALTITGTGTIYGAWRHVYPGNLRDIAFTMSRDGGRSFSSPVRVSEDGWAINGCPDDGPAMVVDPGGTLHVVWPTVIGGTSPEGALFYASSRDGQTFTKRTRVPTLGSPKPSHPQIALDAKGGLVVAWDEVVDGQRVAAVRTLKAQAAAVTFGEPVMLAQGGPATYPVMAAAGGSVVAVWATGGSASRIQVRKLQLP